jgi:hypothetical protein
MLTQLAVLLALGAAQPPAGPPEPEDAIEFKVYTPPPRLLLDPRHLRLLRRERERQSMRWQQFEALMEGRARMPEPGFAAALFGIVAEKPASCREAVSWATRQANPALPIELRQMALAYDWCGEAVGETAAAALARRLEPALSQRPTGFAAVRSMAFAAIALADEQPERSEAALRWIHDTWWRIQVAPGLKAQGLNGLTPRAEVYALVELLHAVRDNLKTDLRLAAAKFFEDLPAYLLLLYYPAPWPAAENEYRIPVYSGARDPNLEEAAIARASEFAMVAYDPNAVTVQFLQGWLMQDRYMMKGAYGSVYEFFWANPYQPGLSYHYLPDLYHSFGRLIARGGWEEEAPWFGWFDGQAQMFRDGRRSTIDTRKPPPGLTLGTARILFPQEPYRFEGGLLEPPQEGERRFEETVLLMGLKPQGRYDVEIDDEEMFEATTDGGGILALRFQPGRKTGVRMRPSPAVAR